MAWPYDDLPESPVDYYDDIVQETASAFDPNTWFGIKDEMDDLLRFDASGSYSPVDVEQVPYQDFKAIPPPEDFEDEFVEQDVFEEPLADSIDDFEVFEDARDRPEVISSPATPYDPGDAWYEPIEHVGGLGRHFPGPPRIIIDAEPAPAAPVSPWLHLPVARSYSITGCDCGGSCGCGG